MIFQSPFQLYAAPYLQNRLKIIQLQWQGGAVEEVVTGGFYAITDGVATGINVLLQWLSKPVPFDAPAMSHLMSVRDEKGINIFSESFLNYLQRFRMKGELWSAPEATPVFAGQPFLQVRSIFIQVTILQLWVEHLIQPQGDFTDLKNFIQIYRFYDTDKKIIQDVIGMPEIPPIVPFSFITRQNMLQKNIIIS